MTGLTSVFDLGAEAAAFIRDSGDKTVTKVIKVESLRDAETVLESVADASARDRILAAWVVQKGGRNVAEVKTAGHAFQSFVDRPGPLVIVVAEKTYRHLICDEALWGRMNPRPEQSTTASAPKPAAPPMEMGEFLGGVFAFLVVGGGLCGYGWWQYRQRVNQRPGGPTNLIPISLPVPANPAAATKLDVSVMIGCDGLVAFATPKTEVPDLFDAAKKAAGDVKFPEGDCDKPLRETTITLAVERGAPR